MDSSRINKESKDNVIVNVSKWRKEYLEKKSVRCKDRFQTINHPLVTSGLAYWIDENNLCLKSNDK